MAVSVEQTKVVVRNMLATGTSASGRVITTPVSIGTLDASNYNDDKAYAISEKLAIVLALNTDHIERVGTAILDEE